MTCLGPWSPALCSFVGRYESHPPWALCLPMGIFLHLKESDPWASPSFHPPGERNLGGTDMEQVWDGGGGRTDSGSLTCLQPHPPRAPGPLHRPLIGILFHPTSLSTSLPPVTFCTFPPLPAGLCAPRGRDQPGPFLRQPLHAVGAQWTEDEWVLACTPATVQEVSFPGFSTFCPRDFWSLCPDQRGLNF